MASMTYACMSANEMAKFVIYGELSYLRWEMMSELLGVGARDGVAVLCLGVIVLVEVRGECKRGGIRRLRA